MARLVPSNSEADVNYRVETNVIAGVEHAYKCECRGFHFRGTCDHIKKVDADPSQYAEVNNATPSMAQAPAGAKMTNAKPLPMLAHVFEPSKVNLKTGQFAVEEKFDGHRLMVRVSNGILQAWSRTGIDSLSKLSGAMRTEVLLLPDGIYDGEIMNTSKGGKSYNVSHLQANSLVYVIFDVLANGDYDITARTYAERRTWLEKCFGGRPFKQVVLAKSWTPQSQEELDNAVQEIWEAGGEGVIVKDRKGTYAAGTTTNKRSRAFLKIKQCQHATLTILGFCETEGEIMNRGRFATAVISDGAVISQVKVLNDEELKRLNDAVKSGFHVRTETIRLSSGKKVQMNSHPFVGRKLLIEYHEQTPDGNYRHARWDRYADE